MVEAKMEKFIKKNMIFDCFIFCRPLYRSLYSRHLMLKYQAPIHEMANVRGMIA
jgi:hypothetical protein